MRPAASALCLAAAMLLTGCAKKVVLAATPPPPPTPTVSVPPPTHPTEPLPDAPVIPSATVSIPVEPVKKPSLPRSRPRTVAPTQTASAGNPPISELGELTTGESNSDTLRRQTDDLLKAQNRRLSGLAPATIALHTHQVDQAKLFLRQAGEAWNKQDIEGARTLATKAKVLLDEILS